MDLFIDCEFDGYKGDLISMALVSEDGDREFYEVVRDASANNPWVRENVVPKLNHDDPVGYDVFQRRLKRFLGQFPALNIIADYPDDVQYFCTAIITGPGEWFGLPNLTFVVDSELSNENSEVLHNALHDARAIRDSYLRKEGVI